MIAGQHGDVRYRTSHCTSSATAATATATTENNLTMYRRASYSSCVNEGEFSTATSLTDTQSYAAALQSPHSAGQIYLNLLILEASLRTQYLSLVARRQKNSLVLMLLTIWIAYFMYAQILRPREDGKGVGGSVYWLIDAGEKVALISGFVMLFLFWVTGQWERGIRWPRRWLTVTNRGLRGFNCKLVVLRGPLWREILDRLSFIIPHGFFLPTASMNYRRIERIDPTKRRITEGTMNIPAYGLLGSVMGETNYRRMNLPAKQGPFGGVCSNEPEFIEEDIASGGDYVKLLLLPKPFSAEFRENWEIYRAEFWERENERRSMMRKQLKAERKKLKEETGRSSRSYSFLMKTNANTRIQSNSGTRERGWGWWTKRRYRRDRDSDQHRHSRRSSSSKGSNSSRIRVEQVSKAATMTMVATTAISSKGKTRNRSVSIREIELRHLPNSDTLMRQGSRSGRKGHRNSKSARRNGANGRTDESTIASMSASVNANASTRNNEGPFFHPTNLGETIYRRFDQSEPGPNCEKPR